MQGDDSRFQSAGFFSFDQLEKANEVYALINSILPLDSLDESDSTFGLAVRKELNLNIFTRRRYSWDIGCEKLYSRDPQTFFHKVAGIRPYFFSLEQLLDFTETSSKHDHTKWGAQPWLHDDNHADKFHVHVEGLIPESVKLYLLVSQAVILTYYLAITILFSTHTQL